jgi:hypothetical protein
METKEMALAKIVTEKIVVDGVKCRRIIGFENILGPEALPDRYMHGVPRFSLSDGYLSASYPHNGDHQYAVGLPIGAPLFEAEFQEILVWLRRAGSRLTKINARLAKENADWHGEETVEI